MSLETTCQWCGKDCEFMRFCDGLCISCADKMQAQDSTMIIAGLAKAVLEVARLRKQIEQAQERGFDI